MKWYWSKYPAGVKVLVIFAGIMGIIMALSDALREEQSVSNGEQIASDALKVKGFYLGMNIDEAAELLNTKYLTRERIEDGTFNVASKPIMDENGQLKEMKKFDKASVEQMEDGTFRIAIDREPEGLNAFYSFATGGLVGGPERIVSIKAGKDKKVTEIFFDSSFTDFLFNSKDMDIDSFAEEFAKAYNIRNFEPFIQEEKSLQYYPNFDSSIVVPTYKNGYKCSSDQGYYIEISEEKNLLIKRIPRHTERSFD